MKSTKNILITLEYDGSRYDGWQKQGNTGNTIQRKIEDVLGRWAGKYIEVCGSGRTDAGVHALGQTANFHIDGNICPDASAAMEYLNRFLPTDIRILSAEEVPENFHARLQAKSKTYEYRIETGVKASVFRRKYVYALGEDLDIDAMKKAAEYLIGKHDFRNFSSEKRSKKSTVRTLTSVDIADSRRRSLTDIRSLSNETGKGESSSKEGTNASEDGVYREVLTDNLVTITYTGDGFLYHMARILTGTLIEIGEGKRRPEEITDIFEAGDRKAAGFTAPPEGLFLVKVEY